MGGSQNRDYIKNQYIPRLTEERMSLYSSINQGIYGHVVRAWGGGSQYIPRLYVTRNIFQYIHRLGVTEEYTFILLGTDEYSAIYSSAFYPLVPSSVMNN
jgi:hypothetical protein